MDNGEIYRVSSTRMNSSTIWRNSAMDVFSKSSRDEDDEEALKWASIERLPTYLRVRRGILSLEGESAREIDVQNLGLLERRNILERLVKIAEEDNERFLLKLKNRMERVGLDLPAIEVRFEHLNVEAEAHTADRALPTIFNFSLNMLEGFLSYCHIIPNRKKHLSILHDVSGIIKPGRISLLLGPPSSGKTTLLRALSGKLGNDLKVSGRVTYNGHGMNEFVPQRTSAYISQQDLHIGEMTVRETLSFSARCQGVDQRYDMLTELSRREKAANIKPDQDLDIIMKAAALGGQETNVVTDYVLKVKTCCNDNQTIYNAERSENEVSLSSRTSSARVGSINEADRNKKRGMVLPFEPHTITFDEIRYAVDMPQEMKSEGVTEDRLELLKGVSGSFRPGVLTALMGVSGAGKTTLMDVLAGRKTGGYIDGNITISGYPKNQETFARISGYCEQTDIHSPHVTVYESLVYSAWLRLPPDVDNATRKMFVEEVMNLIELNPIRDSIVGLPGVNGLSTEQRKRLTIAVELVANPSIIFMDEPTSGLDARAAAIVMRTVRNTVDTGRTVVCTIHQPSIDIFDAFDELFLLRRGGEEIYVGPIGRHSIHLIDYFESIEGVPKIKDGYNPATWMLEVTTASQEANLGVNFNTLYKKSELFRRNKDLIKQLSVPSENSKELYFPTKYSQSFVVQCIACLWKQHLSYWRNPSYSAVRFLFTTIIALMFGTIFWDLGSKRDNQQDLFNAMGSMYAAVLFVGVQNATSVQPVVAIERTVFYREKAAGMYSALPYAFGQVVIELPYIFIQTIVYGVIVYGMIGFEWTAAKFFWYIFFMYFTLLYFTFYGMMTVAVTPNHNIAAIVSSAFYGFWNLFSGFIIPRTKIPIWWRWYYWICPVAWTLYGLVTSQFGDIEDRMDSNQTVAEFVRSYFGYKYDFLGIVAAVHVGFTVLFGFIFAFSIKVFNFQNR
ncbi:Pleiotropic drug resistance protein 1, partial [Cucurbita argyrosperma subsp. sororia]